MDLLTLRRLLARPIAYHKLFVELAGGACPGVFLSQLWYWNETQERTNPAAEGWFYKSLSDWYDETGLSKRELNTARAYLKERGFLTWSERGFGSEKRLYWRLNIDTLLQAMEAMVSAPKPAMAQDEPYFPNSASHILRNGTPINPETENMRIPIRDSHYKEHRLPTQTTSIEGKKSNQKKIGKAGSKFSADAPTPATSLPANDVKQIVPPVARPPRDIAAQIQELEQARTRLSGADRKRATQQIAQLKQQLPVVMPWPSLEFEQAWADWEAHKKKLRSWYASNVTEQKQLDKLSADVEGNEARAIAAIEWSILKNYAGVFEQPAERSVQSPYTPAPYQQPTRPGQVERRVNTMAAVAALDAAEDSKADE